MQFYKGESKILQYFGMYYFECKHHMSKEVPAMKGTC